MFGGGRYVVSVAAEEGDIIPVELTSSRSRALTTTVHAQEGKPGERKF